MATRVKLSTKGFDEYLEAIARAGRDIDAAADEALGANGGGGVILDGMQRRVPKDTGNLESHLNIDGPHRDGNFHFVLVGLNGADADTSRYGTAQEYGWANHPGQPYIRPTLDEDKNKAAKAIKAILQKWGLV